MLYYQLIVMFADFICSWQACFVVFHCAAVFDLVPEVALIYAKHHVSQETMFIAVQYGAKVTGNSLLEKMNKKLAVQFPNDSHIKECQNGSLLVAKSVF